MYAQIVHNGVARFMVDLPFEVKVRNLTPQQLAGIGIVPVVDVTPLFNPGTQRLARRVPPTVVIYPDRVEITRSIVRSPT